MSKEKLKYEGKYTLGFDIGVASVGFSAIDENDNPLMYHGQKVFGTRLFREASTAENRRLARGTRRRYRRRMRRLQLLQEEFYPLISEVDNSFFDKDVDNKKWKNNNKFENRTLSEVLISLGRDPKEFKTIYHLRKSLIENNEREDIRLIYLAVHHMIKYRGHFLNPGEGTAIDANINLTNILKDLNDSLVLDDNTNDKIMNILYSDSLKKAEKQRNINVIFTDNFKEYSNQLKEISKLLLGYKANMKKLFDDDELLEIKTFSFNDESLDESLSQLNNENYDFISKVYNLFLSINLKEILGAHEYFSFAQVELYNEFNNDLNKIRNLIKQNESSEDYNKIFVSSKSSLKKYEEDSDSSGLCMFDIYNKLPSIDNGKFLKEITRIIQHMGTPDSVSIIDKITNDDFLVKQRSSRNAAVPHQLNLMELMKILNNQSKYYPKMTTEFIDHLRLLLKFRIPYSVGPLEKNKNNEFAWSSRFESDNHERVKPWNFESIIDVKASSAEFIHRMTNNCSYILKEPVLPKRSLLIQLYEVLNEFNGINYRPESERVHRKYRIGEHRDMIFNELFLKKEKCDD